MKIHIPPRFDQYGNRQLWIVETESGADEIINGAIFGILASTTLIFCMTLTG